MLTVAHEERIRRQELREHERKEDTEAAQSKRKIIEKQSTEKKKSSTEQEDSSAVPDSQQDPEVIEPTPPQDHQPSLTDSEVDKENRVVSPVDIDSNIEIPRGADNTVLDYTGLGLDIEFPNKSGISAVGEDLINFPELDIRPTDKHRTTLDEVQSEIFRLFDSFLIDNKNIMELIANKLSNRVTKNFQRETKIAEENQRMITQIIEFLANKDNKFDKEMEAQMAKAVTDVLSQCIEKNKDGQSLDSIKESLVEIKERNDDSEFRGQPNIRHFDVGLKIDIEDWIKKYKDAMSDKKASIEKQVSQLKLLTDGAVNAWVKDRLREEDYENKKAKGQLTQEWFDKLLKKMKDQFTNLNPWVGELRFQSLVLKDNEEVQDYYSRVYLEGRKLGKSDQDVANAFLRGLPFTYQVHVLNQKPTTAAQYVDAAQTYESMCKLGNAEAARLKPPLKIATLSGTSPLHELARESEAIDQAARELITQMTEAIKTMGKVIDKNENENKQLKKKVSQLAPTLQYCNYCNRSGHTDSICQTKIANEQNQPTNYSGNYNTSNQSVGNYNPSSSYNQQYYPQGNYSSPPVYQDQGQRQNYQGQQHQNYQGGWNQNRRQNDRGGYNGHGAYSNRGNYGYGRSRDANSKNWRRNPGQGLNGNQNNIAGNQQTLNNDSGGNRYRTNSSDKNNLN